MNWIANFVPHEMETAREDFTDDKFPFEAVECFARLSCGKQVVQPFSHIFLRTLLILRDFIRQSNSGGIRK
jgi:hypothetical protein